MAETNFFQLFKATWAQNGTTDRISAAQYSAGWAYIGSLPPTVEQFNAVQQFTDQKLTWVYRHLEAVATLTGRQLTAAGSDAISYAFQNLNASRLTAGTVPVERLPEKAPAMTVGAAAKWETPCSISISGGATAREILFDGSADVALEVFQLDMRAAVNRLSPVNGGTGMNWVPPGNYLVGNGTATMTSKTPGQVLADIGAASLDSSRRVPEINSRYPNIRNAEPGVDLNTYTESNDFYVRAPAPNTPPSWTGQALLRVRGWELLVFQEFIQWGAGATRWWRMRVNATTWGPWRRIAELDGPAFTGAPTAPTPALTDNSTRLATTAHVAGSVRAALDAYAATRGRSSAQFGATGWWRCGDTGFIRQWGVSRIPYDSEAWVTYPIAFPNMCLGGNATHAERFLVTQDAGVGLIAAGSTAAIVRNGVGADSRAYLPNPADRASLIYWEVWGY
ncbi:pyocin knob domain-containing protein [Achromobacter ruhlandii]|uniref:pyocin knob domain-containing protein n=1 Tax=Achromobacter ruhlandii TaxID=72557 RepID=UPI000C25CE0B|nr:pyocin knob domain-containing protein [Achromobacter ruhlandii]PJM89054.1 hypothetical protein CV044_12055 [Achromobacter ruhlandii]